MRVDDLVLFVENLGDEPQQARVVGVYQGTPWVRIRTSSGQEFDQVLAATHRFQSPKGYYCIKDTTCENSQAV